jgi:CheY-like chemotaxis protein
MFTQQTGSAEILKSFGTSCECSQILIVDDIDMNRFVLKQIFYS